MSYNAEILLEGITPYSQSRMHRTPGLEKEKADEYDERTWLEKAHWDAEGHLYVPAMSVKMALDAVAAYLGEKIPGRGNHTYSKHLRSGVLVLNNLPVFVNGQPVTRENVLQVGINAHSDGKRGSGKRVWRRFPQINPPWSARGSIMVVDHTVDPGLLQRYLSDAGNYIGIGRFRPENGGINGRFVVRSFNVEES